MKIIIILNAIGCGIINYTESNRFSKYSECRDVNEAIHYKTGAETKAFVTKAKACMDYTADVPCIKSHDSSQSCQVKSSSKKKKSSALKYRILNVSTVMLQ